MELQANNDPIVDVTVWKTSKIWIIPLQICKYDLAHKKECLER